MSDFGGDLDPIIQRFIIQMDPVQAAAFKVATEKAVRAAQQAMTRETTRGTSKAMAEVTRITLEATRRRYQQQERLALTAGKSEGEIVKRTASTALAIQKQAATQELQVQRRHQDQRTNTEKRWLAKWEETTRRHYFRMKGQYRDAQQDEEQSSQRHRTRMGDHERTFWKFVYAEYDDFLKRRRSRQRAAEFQELADSKIAGRRAWEQQRSQNSRDLTILREHQRRVTNSHKAMWSIIRSATETGGRFMSSITQSALRSMGNAVGIGLRRITSIHRREQDEQQDIMRRGTNRQESILRDSMSDQTRIVTRELARQEGAMSAFQATAQRGALRGFMNLRNLALGGAGFLSARAIFGPVADYEQTRIAFEALLGSAERSNAFLTQMQNFAKTTPFDFAGVSEGARRLLAVGFAANDVIPALTDIGNVAANLGAGTEEINGVIRALGQMKGKGKASAEELNQISEQLPGFSAVDAIARSLGITVADAFDMMKKGALPADIAIQAILDGMRDMPGAAAAMERQSRTLNGRLSTLKDTLEILVIDALTPFIDEVANAVGVFTTMLDSLFNGRGVWAIVRSGLLGISIALGAIVAQRGAVAVMQLMGTALTALKAAALNHPFIAFATVLTVLGTMLYRHNDTFREFVDGFLDRVAEFATRYGGPVAEAFSDVADSIGELASMVMAGEWRDAATFLSDFFTESYDNALAWVRGGGIGELYDQIGERIDTAVEQMLNSPSVEWLVEFASTSWERYQEWLDSGGLGDLADSIKWRVLDAVVKVRDGIKNIEWERFMTPAILGVGAAIVALFVLNLPLWLVAGIALALSSPRLREGFEEKVLPKLEQIFEGQNWTPVVTTLAIGLGAALVLAFTAPGFAVPALIVTAIAGAIAAAAGNPQARKAFKKVGDSIAGWIGDAFDDVDWVGVYGSLLSGIEKVTAKITKWLVGFITSKEFVAFVAGLTVILSGLLGAVIVGVVEGLVKGIWEALFDKGSILGPTGMWDDIWERLLGIDDIDFGAMAEGVVNAIGTFFKGVWEGLDPSNWLPKSPRFAAMGNEMWALMKPGFSYLFEQLDAVTFGFLGVGLSMADGFLGAFKNFGSRLLKAIMKGLGSASSFAQDFVNAIINAINTGLIDKLNDINIGFDPPFGPSFSYSPDIGHIPEVALAKGGIVNKPTIALIGEAGPEAVIPLSGNAAGTIPFTISFDASMIAAQVDAIVAIMAPMGERLVAATTPGMRMWANAVERVLGRILSGFETWGDRMVTLAEAIAAGITAGITGGLREGKREVVRITRGYARSLVGALNPLLQGIGEEPIQLNFAKGGIAEAHHGAQVHVFNEGRRGRGSSHGEAYIPFDPSNRPRSRDLASETVRRLGGDVQWYARGGLSPEAIRRGQTFARAQDGKPYQWGAVGPNSYDCSGLAGAIVNVVQNAPNPYARRFTSATLSSGQVAGLIRGPGQVTIGARSGNPGHVTTNIAGLKAESTNGSVRVGPRAASVAGFPHLWHLGSGVFLGEDGTVYPVPDVPDAGKRGWLSSTAKSMMSFVRDKVQGFVDANTYTGSSSAFESVMAGMQSGPASPEIMAAIRRAMGIVGVPSSWLGPLLTLISRESSYNPNAYNSILGASGLMQCVPLDSEILTRRGWLTHDEVRIGDETLGYNPESGRSEWTPITKIVHYENAPIVRIGNKRWGARVTPNHRWFSDTEVTRKPEHLTVCPECGYESNPRGVSTHRGRMHGVNGSATTEYVGEFVRTYDLSSHHRIRLAAQADTDGIPTLSLDEVRIIAWLQGDGTVRPALEGGFDGAIYQSKPQHVATLRALLSGVPHTESTRQRNPEYLPAVTFALRRSFVSDLWKRAEIEDIGPEAFVLSLSPEQRSAWLGAMIDAEGNRQIAGRQTKEHVRITQVDGELQDAITLAVYLEGYRPSFSAFTRYEDRHQPAGNVGMCAPHVVPSQFQEPVDLPPETVWCVKTDLETWTMRQDGQVMLTGNTIPSTFAAYALPGYGGIFNPVANVIAGLRYILARYGTIFNVGQATSPTPTRGYSYGGIVERDGLYRLAEGNRREAILPLDNPGRTNEILRRLGLADTFAMSSKADRGSVSRSRSERVAGDAAPMIGSVVGEMHVHSNAQDENAVATITANKIDKKLRLALSGV